LSLSCVIAACATSTDGIKIYRGNFATDNNPNAPIKTIAGKKLSVQYMGVGGQLFQFGDDAIMTGPSFTNPGFFRLGYAMPISTDEEIVDRMIPDVSNVEMILIGHAHYDHLMDVPYVMNKHALKAKVYGSNTMGHIMAAAVDKSRIVPLNSQMAQGDNPGQWQYNNNRTIRIMAVKSTHAPHFMGIKIMGGTYEKDLTSLPWHSFAWKEGQTLSYVIDFMDGNRVAYRTYYQDAASEPDTGLLPKFAAQDQHPVDLTILCPAAFAQVDNYPESILQNTQPKKVLLGHWEDFFGNIEDVASGHQDFVRATDPDEFFERLEAAMPEGSTWVMPYPFATLNLAP
jgi:hypothetical protein